MHDLINWLQNYALSEALESERRKRAAAEIRREPGGGGEFPEYDRSIAIRAEAELREAVRCDARAAEAKRGYLLLDASDITFQMDPRNASLINEALAQKRVRYIGEEVDTSADTYI